MTREETKEKDFQTIADEYARGMLESIRDDLAALEHAQACTGRDENGDECKRGSEKSEPYQQLVHECPEDWHDEEAARRHIEEGPLSVEVRSDWYTPGSENENKPTEYNILLGTGGPAARIIGDLNDCGQPESAHFEYQDWYKPWTRARLSGEEEDVLLAYARCFYFGG